MPGYKHIIILLVLTIGLIIPSFAQDWEVGAWGGFSNYFGDLNTHVSFEYIGPGTGFFARYNISTRFANKSDINYGIVSANDASSSDPFEKARNLSFKSNIVEVSDELEFNFFKYDKHKPEFAFTPYLFVGLSAFYFNPVANYQGVNYSLQPIGTEGQNAPGNSKYVRVSAAIPVGGGFKYSFHPAWTLGAEIGFRKTLTNYLDDVASVYPTKVVSYTTSSAIARALSDRSGEVGEPIGTPGKQRGTNNNATDSYMFLGLTISYTMLKMHCPKISNIH